MKNVLKLALVALIVAFLAGCGGGDNSSGGGVTSANPSGCSYKSTTVEQQVRDYLDFPVFDFSGMTAQYMDIAITYNFASKADAIAYNNSMLPRGFSLVSNSSDSNGNVYDYELSTTNEHYTASIYIANSIGASYIELRQGVEDYAPISYSMLNEKHCPVKGDMVSFILGGTYNSNFANFLRLEAYYQSLQAPGGIFEGDIIAGDEEGCATDDEHDSFSLACNGKSADGSKIYNLVALGGTGYGSDDGQALFSVDLEQRNSR